MQNKFKNNKYLKNIFDFARSITLSLSRNAYIKFKKRFAFTLAEIMIVLTVIGIITAILLPVGINSMPNQNVMKFKKAHNTLYQVIHELVSSDKYFMNGQFEKKPDGSTVISGDQNSNMLYYNYIVDAFADVVSTKDISYKNNSSDLIGFVIIPTGTTQATLRDEVDSVCNNPTNAEKWSKIELVDGTVWMIHANRLWAASNNITRCSDAVYRNGYPHVCELDGTMYYRMHYAPFCIDVDGDGEETPFGYAIRGDGKIIAGAKALEWLDKSMTDKD